MRGCWEVVWSHAGLWALRELPWRDAARIDAAVMRFEATNEQALQRIQQDFRRALLAVKPDAQLPF